MCAANKFEQYKCKTHFMVTFTLLSLQVCKETEEKSNVKPFQFNAMARIQFLIAQIFCQDVQFLHENDGMHNTKPHKK